MGDVLPASIESRSPPPKQLLSSALGLDLLTEEEEGTQLEISPAFFSFDNCFPGGERRGSMPSVSKPLSHLCECEILG